MTRMTIELYDRRKKMLELHFAGVSHHLSFQQISFEEGIPVDAIRKDWQRRSQWQDLIWRMTSDCKNVQELLYNLQLGREKALRLVTIARGDNVKGGALWRLAEFVKLEVQLRQSLGQYPRVVEGSEVEKQEMKLDFEVTEEESNILNRAAAILEKKMRDPPAAQKLH